VAAVDVLRAVAEDHSAGGRHRPAVKMPSENLDDGWVVSDD
jgi:hypothetical protein